MYPNNLFSYTKWLRVYIQLWFESLPQLHLLPVWHCENCFMSWLCFLFCKMMVVITSTIQAFFFFFSIQAFEPVFPLTVVVLSPQKQPPQVLCDFLSFVFQLDCHLRVPLLSGGICRCKQQKPTLADFWKVIRETHKISRKATKPCLKNELEQGKLGSSQNF